MPCGGTMSEERRQLMDAACEPKPRLGDQQAGRDGRVQAWPYRPRNALSFPPELGASRAVCRVAGGGDGGVKRGRKDSRLALPPPGRLPLRRKRWVHQRARARGRHLASDINHAATRIQAGPGSAQGGRRSQTDANEFEYAFVRMTPSPCPVAGSRTGSGACSGSAGGVAWAEGVQCAAASGADPDPDADPYADADADADADAGLGAGAAAAASPMMTWGCIDGTPLVLDPVPARQDAEHRWTSVGGNGCGYHASYESDPRESGMNMHSLFRIAELPPRDRRAQRLAHAAGRQRRGEAERRARRQRSTAPLQSAKQFTQLSPAAQSLAARVMVGKVELKRH